jgi:DNA-binding CsgD family transcriptional regulator
MYVATPVPDGCPLHPGQWNTLRLLAAGGTYAQIALDMSVTVSTVRTALHACYLKLDVHNGHQAIAVAWEAGWMDPVGCAWGDDRVTPAQRLYLDAFERYTHAHRDEIAQRRARKEMSYHLGSMCLERGLQKLPQSPREPSQHNPRLEGLLAMLTSA